MSALNNQVGGDHYKDMPIGPTEFSQVNKLNACESHIIQYLCRHHQKGGVQDLRKAQHLIDMIIELEYPEEKPEIDRDSPAKKETFSEFCSRILDETAQALGIDPEEITCAPGKADWVAPRIDPVEGFTTRSQILKESDMEWIDKKRKAERETGEEDFDIGKPYSDLAEKYDSVEYQSVYRATPDSPLVQNLAAAMCLNPVEVATAVNKITASPTPAQDALDVLRPMFISQESAKLVLNAIMAGDVPGVKWTGV